MTSDTVGFPNFIVKDCIYATVQILLSYNPSILQSYNDPTYLQLFYELQEASLSYTPLTSLISTNQHEFMNKRSTANNFVSIAQLFANTLDTQIQIDVLYTDIQKEVFQTIASSINIFLTESSMWIMQTQVARVCCVI